MSARSLGTRLAAAFALLGVVAACSAEDASSAPEPRPSVSVSTAPAAPAPPAVGSCHQISLAQATEPVASDASVPCGKPHTSVTVKVGELTPVVDGHLLAVDSRTVRAQIAAACPNTPGKYVGGDTTSQRLSRFEVVWFSPSLEQADAGANWYRCDIVALRSEGELVTLPAKIKDVLSRPGALDRFGTCGTSAPDKSGFNRVVCSEKHSWRAVDVVDLPPGTRYLAKDASARGDSACKDVAASRADGALKYTWSFEWPARAQWKAGQRYGYCWVPEA